MNLLFTGRGGSGSFTIRAEQIGAALGATVKPHAARADFAACDAAVVVKRAPETLLRELRASGKPWAYDVLDCYPQPASSDWSRGESIRWMQQYLRALDPPAVIWPNQRMREDCDEGRRGIVLPHHARPGLARNPIREAVTTVGYEGRTAYLQEWAMALHKECERRGWTFVVNPPALADLDIIVAFRGGLWDGYAARHWKSNVKLANAHGSTTPFVGRPDNGYLETASGAEYWAESPRELRVAFDWLESQSTREQVADRFARAALTVDAMAARLAEFMRTV